MMTTKILIATHGRFADGIYDSLGLIAGDIENVDRVCMYVDEKVDYSLVIRNYLQTFDYQRFNLLVITDLFGGSINNEFMSYIDKFPFYLIAGLNLSLLLEFCLLNEELTKKKILEVIEHSNKSITLCNDLVCLTEESF